jgi:uncharacterized DUF497 family protein
MIVDFDSAKDEANRVKHGVPLAFGVLVFEDAAHVVLPSLRPIDGENRYKAVGMVGGELWTAVHVWRGATVRMISVRRSNAGEQRDHDRDPGGSE